MSQKITTPQGRRTALFSAGAAKNTTSNKGVGSGGGTSGDSGSGDVSGNPNTNSMNGHRRSATPNLKTDNKSVNNQQKVEQQQQQHIMNTTSNKTENKDNASSQITTRKQSSSHNNAGNSKSQSINASPDNKFQSQQRVNQTPQAHKNDNKLQEVSVAIKDIKGVRADKDVKANKTEKEKKNEKEDRKQDKSKDTGTVAEKSQNVPDIIFTDCTFNSNTKSDNKEQSELPSQENFGAELLEKSNKVVESPVTPKKLKEERKVVALNKVPISPSAKGDKSLCEEKEIPESNNEIVVAEPMETEPVTVNNSPSKPHESDEIKTSSLKPTATSTPGKGLRRKNITSTTDTYSKSEVQMALQTDYKIERPRSLIHITGRRNIRPLTDYTLSNLPYRESYRRINTELDMSSSSMNVTVGSAIHNNSFSFFGRGRKRERPTPSQSKDLETSPPKKARSDFCRAVLSPLTMLRSRFSRTSIQSSSTPLKENLDADKFVQEEANSEPEHILDGVDSLDENTESGDVTIGEEPSSNNSNDETKDKNDFDTQETKSNIEETDDIKVREISLQVNGATPKNRRCVLM